MRNVRIALLLTAVGMLVSGCAAPHEDATTLAVEPPRVSSMQVYGGFDASQDIMADKWHGLSPAPTSLMGAIQHGLVETESGESLPLPLTKPILVFAPWCEYCHKTIQLLKKEGLLDRVTWVAAGLDTYGSALSLTLAEDKVRQSFEMLHVPEPEHVFYAMPGSALDLAVTRFPTVLIPHDHAWYLQSGYVHNPEFWKVILSS